MEETIKKYNICKENCNGVLSRLYSNRDKISEKIDFLLCRNINTEKLETEYDQICREIRHICTWRSENPGCLLEGDPGFRYC